jgi:hypothetical protein
MIEILMRTVPGMNTREHWRTRARRVKAEHEVCSWELARVERVQVPCSVLLTRCSPGNPLDDDNLAGALKTVRDAVALWLGVDDRHSDTVRYRYTQHRTKRGDWRVRIEFGPAELGSQHVLDFLPPKPRAVRVSGFAALKPHRDEFRIADDPDTLALVERYRSSLGDE